VGIAPINIAMLPPSCRKINIRFSLIADLTALQAVRLAPGADIVDIKICQSTRIDQSTGYGREVTKAVATREDSCMFEF
jgi:hypothetical protein